MHGNLQRFKALIEKALSNNGTLIIHAFSIGRTQELLYEFEEIIYLDASAASQNIVGASKFVLTSAHG